MQMGWSTSPRGIGPVRMTAPPPPGGNGCRQNAGRVQCGEGQLSGRAKSKCNVRPTPPVPKMANIWENRQRPSWGGGANLYMKNSNKKWDGSKFQASESLPSGSRVMCRYAFAVPSPGKLMAPDLAPTKSGGRFGGGKKLLFFQPIETIQRLLGSHGVLPSSTRRRLEKRGVQRGQGRWCASGGNL